MNSLLINLVLVTLSLFIIYSNSLSLCSRKSRAKAADEAGYGPQPPKCKLWCPMLLRPVRGTDGHTYSNYCQLKKAICQGNDVQLDHLGICGRVICDEKCSSVAAPVCGSNNKTYRNQCELNQAMVCAGEDVEMVYETECRPDGRQCHLPCTYIPWVVCGTDGKTYGHPCQIDSEKCQGREVDVAHEGKCKPTSGPKAVEEQLDDYY